MAAQVGVPPLAGVLLRWGDPALDRCSFPRGMGMPSVHRMLVGTRVERPTLHPVRVCALVENLSLHPRADVPRGGVAIPLPCDGAHNALICAVHTRVDNPFLGPHPGVHRGVVAVPVPCAGVHTPSFVVCTGWGIPPLRPAPQPPV